MGGQVIRFFGEMRLWTEVAKQPPADIELTDACNLEGVCGKGLGAEKWKVISTPGHTPGSICL
jgi:glyoxylase-like metal-dependent hydrolase (beta-lactamase superfamily II)